MSKLTNIGIAGITGIESVKNAAANIKTGEKCVLLGAKHKITRSYRFVQNEDLSVSVDWESGPFSASAHVRGPQDVDWSFSLNGRPLTVGLKETKNEAKRYLDGLCRADAVFGMADLMLAQDDEQGSSDAGVPDAGASELEA